MKLDSPRRHVLLTLMITASCGRAPNVEGHASALAANFSAGLPLSFGTNANALAFGDHDHAAVAYGGGVFLTVWCSTSESMLYAARTRASDGVLLDQTRIRVAPATFLSRPEVDWDGQNFLVVWSSQDNAIFGARVGSDGHVVDITPILLHAADMHAADMIDQLAIAFGGGSHLVTWRETPSVGPLQYDVLAARFDTDGKMLGSALRLGALPTDEDSPAVAFDGTNFLIVWEDHRGDPPLIYGSRVRASDGTALDGAGGFRIGTSLRGSAPAVAFDGTNYLVASLVNESGLVGARLRPGDHSAVDAHDLALLTVPSTGPSLNAPHLIFDGAHLVMSWAEGTPAGAVYRLARIDAGTGANLDGSGIMFDTSHSWVDNRDVQSVAAGAGRLFAVYNEEDNGQQLPVSGAPGVQTKGVFVDPTSGTVAPSATLLCRSAHWQTAPATSSDGQQHLLTWQEWNGNHWDIRAGRVSGQTGAALDPTGFTIASSDTADQYTPRAASNGANHLVVWGQGASLRAMRVKGSDASLLDGSGVVLPAVADFDTWDSPRYDVASDGKDYLVFWIYGSPLSSTRLQSLRAVRVRGSDGALLDSTPLMLAPDAMQRSYARLAFCGSYYLAVSIGLTSGSGYQVLGVRVASDGTVVDSTPLVIGKTDGSSDNPVMACDGENMLVAWVYDPILKARRVRMSDGSVLDSTDLVLVNHISFQVAGLTFDGQEFLAVWPRYVGTPVAGGPIEFVAARVSKTGTLVDAVPTVIVPAPTAYLSSLSLSPDAAGNVLFGYQVYDTAADIETTRVRARLLSDPPPPDAAPPPPPPADAAPADVAGASEAAVSPPPDAGADAMPINDGSASPDGAASADGDVPADGGIAIADGAAPDVGDTAISPREAGASVDSSAPGADSAASAVDVAAVPLDGAGALDAASDRQAGGGTGCACAVTGRVPRPPTFALVLLGLLLVRAYARRRV